MPHARQTGGCTISTTAFWGGRQHSTPYIGTLPCRVYSGSVAVNVLQFSSAVPLLHCRLKTPGALSLQNLSTGTPVDIQSAHWLAANITDMKQ